jgi:hypothetical protein
LTAAALEEQWRHNDDSRPLVISRLLSAMARLLLVCSLLVCLYLEVMALVTVYRAFSSADAQLVRSRLEVSDLHAVVNNETAALSMDGYSMAAGGILVQVPAEEADAARELIGLDLSAPE